MKKFFQIIIGYAALLLLYLIAFPTSDIAYADSTGYKTATTILSATGADWTNLDKTTIEDGIYATAVYNGINATSILNLEIDFGIIPANAVIDNVDLRFKGYHTGGKGSGGSLCLAGAVEDQGGTTTGALCFGRLTTSNTMYEKLAATFSSPGLTPQNINNKEVYWNIEISLGQNGINYHDYFAVNINYTTPDKTPLILIPGIGGSELKSDQTFTSEIKDCGILPPFTYTIDDVIWLDIINAGSSLCDDYFDVLKLNPDGQTPQFPQIVLNGTFVPLAYGDFIDFFTDEGYMLNETLFLFPYDWRKDISLTKFLLDQKIEFIKQQTGKEKVDIVAHSMGGLVARNYIKDIETAQKVRKLIVLGTPHLGSPEYIKNLMYGGCLSKDPFKKPICFGVSPSEVKDVIQNMISGYELSPSQTYFNFYSGEDNLHPFPLRDDRDIDNNDVTGPLNYSQIKTLLTDLGHNTALFTPSEAFHALDENLTDTNGVEVSTIAGSGNNTLGQIIEKYRLNFKGIKIPQRDKITINGDETVPLLSASLIDSHKNLSLLGSASLYYTNQKHGKLVENGSALNLVSNILNDDATLPDGVSLDPYKLKGRELSVHSPVEIHVYDQDGNHTGKTPDGDFEANIPGSSYDTIEDAKFIWLPDEGVYNIEFEGTGEGSFDFKIRKFENDLNSQTILYKDVPLTNSTKASGIFDTQSLQPPILNLDTNGDEIDDFQAGYFSILEGDANYDHTPPNISIDVSPKTIWPPNGKMVDITVTGTISDENPYVTTILVEDEYDLVEPSITTFETEINQTIRLEAFRREEDKEGRAYTIKVLATDLAGNTSLASVEVLVPHDQRK